MITSETPYKLAEIIRDTFPNLYRPAKVIYRNKGILIDFKSSSDFWNTYKNPFEPIVKKGYNAYLKSNKQQKGVDSYNYVVDLLISYFRESVDN